MKNLQILSKSTDEFGIHLIVKNKENESLHIEGHDLSKDGLGKKAILRETPSYYFPIDQNYVDEIIDATF